MPACEHDAEDGRGNHQASDGVGQRPAQPDADSPGQHRQAGQAVNPGVQPVGHQGGAADFPADLYPEEGHCFVAQKTHNRRRGYRPKEVNFRRVEQPADGRVPRKDPGDQYENDNNQPRQVFDPPQSVGEPAGGPAPGQGKRRP